jgi:chromosome segregation ATPase
MNRFGFLMRRLAWQLGIKRERQRWASVNRETQILTEAEDLLGRLAWRDCGEIDELSGEFWQIRDLELQQDKLRAATEEATERNEELRDQLEEAQDEFDDRMQDLRETKSRKMDEVLGLVREVEDLKGWKEQTKKKFMTLKAKLKVIQAAAEGSEPEEVERTRGQMAQLKEQFEGDLQQIAEKTAQIEVLEKEVEEIDATMSAGKVAFREDTADLSTQVGKLSKQIAEFSAKIGALETAKSQYLTAIGMYLSSNLETNDPAIRAVVRHSRYRSLVSRIQYYRRSIGYNQRLARRTQP